MGKPLPKRAPLAIAYGGGGLFGIAYLLGVTESLIKRGVPLAQAPSVGTSAGAWAAAGVELGISWPEAMESLGGIAPRMPNPRSGRLREAAAKVFGERRAYNIRVMVTELPRMRRVALKGADYPAADLVAASSSVPGLLPPHRIGRRRYIDGGVRSMASADRAAPADHLLVIAPLAGPMFGPAGGVMERSLLREMHRWSDANPEATHSLIRPNRAIAALARRPDQLFGQDRADECYDLARRQGDLVFERWQRAYPGTPLA